MAKGVAINVGANTEPEWGGFRGPIFPNGSFEFVHIPWKEKYGTIQPQPKKYESYKSFESYIQQRLRNRYTFILESPDFVNCCYASTDFAPAANKHIANLSHADFLLFYATLDFVDDGAERENWINPRWGAYLVGLFKVDKVYLGLKNVLAENDATESFRDYAWFKSLRSIGIDDDKGAPWVKGIKKESGILPKAIPLSRPEEGNSQKWSSLARELFRTSTGKVLGENAVFQAVLKCEGECLDKLLKMCVLHSK